MDFLLKCDKKGHFDCSMYYMRRYFGLREILLMTFLLIAGVLLFLFAENIMILIFFGVTVAVLLFTTLLFVWTSISGYKHDLVKQGIAYEKVHLDESNMTVNYLNVGGEQIFSETHDYSAIEAVVIKKNFIYIYAGIAIFYYIRRKDFDEKEYLDICNYLRTYVPAEKFKFKTVKKIYPKKKKITIDSKEPEEKKKKNKK